MKPNATVIAILAVGLFNPNIPLILEIKINKQDDITLKLIDNMLTCLKELEKKYSKNIKINKKSIFKAFRNKSKNNLTILWVLQK